MLKQHIIKNSVLGTENKNKKNLRIHNRKIRTDHKDAREAEKQQRRSTLRTRIH